MERLVCLLSYFAEIVQCIRLPTDDEKGKT